MSTKEAVQSLPEYVNVPLAELVESSTNPRKTFDAERLEELADSIRSKGVLSPLLARRVNADISKSFSGAGATAPRSERGCQRRALFGIVDLSDEEALETQIIENIQRADVSIRSRKRKGFGALLERTKGPGTPSRRYRRKPVRMFCIHRQTPSALGPDSTCGRCVHGGTHRHRARLAHCQTRSERAGRRHCAHCFDGANTPRTTAERSVSSRQPFAGVDNAGTSYLSLISVPFSKDDETLVPEAGSCANCPKRTGFNTLLFSEVPRDSDSMRGCRMFQPQARRDHRGARFENAESGADFGQLQCAADGTPILARRNYVEVVTRKTSKAGKGRTGPEEKLCSHLSLGCHSRGRQWTRRRPREGTLRGPKTCKVSLWGAGNRKKNSGSRGRPKRRRQTKRRNRPSHTGTAFWPTCLSE